MSDLKPDNQTQFVFQIYPLRDTSLDYIMKPPEKHRARFQGLQTRLTCTAEALEDFLSPQNLNLFSRKIAFLTKAQINALPAEIANKGWKTLFEAMYLFIQQKHLPKDLMSAEEIEQKKVNLVEAMTLLKSLVDGPEADIDPKIRPIALMLIGYMHKHSLATKLDIEKAKALFLEAKNLGMIEANIELSSIETDLHRAIQYLTEAKDQGSIDALVKLGYILSLAGLSTFNLEKAEEYLSIALEKGNGNAALQLSDVYSRHYQGKKNNTTAVDLLHRASDLQIPEASVLLGNLYKYGTKDIKPNLKKAEELYMKAHKLQFGEASRYLASHYSERKLYSKAVYYALKSLRYGSSKATEILQFVVNITNNLTSSRDRDEKIKITAMMSSFDAKNLNKIFNEYNNIFHNSDTDPIKRRKDNEDLYQGFLKFHNDERLRRLQNFAMNKSPEEMDHIIQTALPLFFAFNSAYCATKPLITKKDSYRTFVSTLKKNTSHAHICENDFLEKLLDTYASLSLMDHLFLSSLVPESYFFSQIISHLPPNLLTNAKTRQTIMHKAVKLTLQKSVITLEEFHIIFPETPTDLAIHKNILQMEYYQIISLIDNLTGTDYKMRSLDYIICIAICIKYLNQVNRLEMTRSEYERHFRKFLQQMGTLCKIKITLQSDLNDYSQADQKIIIKALKDLGFDNKQIMNYLSTSVPKTIRPALMQKLTKIEKAIDNKYNSLFAADIEAERAQKEAEAEQKALETQRKRQEIQKNLWHVTQQNAEKTCTSCREKIKTTEMSDIRRENLSALLDKMVEMHQLIQDTTEYTQAHNTHFQNLKKQFDEILGLPPTQIAEDYELIAGSAIAEVETYMSDSLNAKKEILKRIALKQAEEAEKLAKIEAAQATRAANRAAKQKEYQEEQEVLKAQETDLKSESSSDDEVATKGAIASFEDSKTEDILKSQTDHFSGKVVNILNLINNARNFIDIPSNLSKGQMLHELQNEDTTLPTGEKSTCYAIKVNKKYRITFYWSTTENKAYKVWFGDYHV